MWLYKTKGFIVCIKTNGICKNVAEDVETRFDRTELDRPLPKGKNKKVIELIKGELGGNIMTKYIGLRKL